MREIAEESGLTSIRVVRKLAEVPDPEWGNVRHTYHVELAGDAPDHWTHRVRGKGEDAGMIFEYSWRPIDDTLHLVGHQDQWISQSSSG